MRLWAALCLLWFAMAVPLAAQSFDDGVWERTASRAEAALDAGRASTAVFEGLRAELARFRAGFLDAQSINSDRIETLTTQLDALGPEPEDAMEAPEVAERRAELVGQLDTLTAPGRRAEEAYTRADGLIREIDRVIRERQADVLLTLGPSPLNPANWGAAVDAVSASLLRIGEEIGESLATDTRRAALRSNLPLVLFYTVLGLVLVIRGRVFVEQIALRIQERSATRYRRIWAFLISLGQVAVPVFGLYALVEAVSATSLLGFRGTLVLEVVPAMGLAIYFGLWLAGRSFPKGAAAQPLNLPPERQRLGRWTGGALAVTVAASLLLREIAELGAYAPIARAVLGFTVFLFGGILLVTLGRMLLAHAQSGGNDGPSYRTTIQGIMARGAIVIGFASPLLAGVGYFDLAEAMLRPAILTLGLSSFLSAVRRFVSEFYRLVLEVPEDEGEPLIPVLFGVTLSILALPVLALIWGARVSDLTELWSRFLKGIDIGGSRISPVDILTVILVFGLGMLLTRLLQGTLRVSVLPRTSLDIGGQRAITAGVGYFGILVAGLSATAAAGLDLSSLAIFASALAIGIGFGLRTIVSNFVSGIILLIERPISEGDWIEVGEQMGIVRSISVRATRIETFDRRDVIVPNEDLVSGTVTNWTRGNVVGRLTVSVGVGYGSDSRQVEQLLAEICADQVYVAKDPPPKVVFQAFGADALEFQVHCILTDINQLLLVRSDINHAIHRRFREAGIEIPFAQRDLWLRNPEALAQETRP